MVQHVSSALKSSSSIRLTIFDAIFWNIFSNDETKVLRIIMHSAADPVLNELAMQEPNKNIRKIILATNIAESSITVPHVKYGKT